MNSSSPTTNTRRPCFIEEDNGLASIAEMRAEFSANTHYNNKNNHTALHRKRSSRLSNLESLHGLLYYDARHDEDQQQQTHFLDACFLCKKPLGDRDIFMYRGDTPFCSEECRQEQIEMDEAKEKSLNNLSASMKALSKKDQRRSTSPDNCTFRTSTVAAA